MYILFLGFWILLNGKFTLEIFLFGLVIAAAVYAFICRYMDFSLKKDFLLCRSAGFLILYFLVLLREIFLANINVLKLIYSPKYEPEPGYVRFRTDLKTRLCRVLLANSITLTPGTITVSVEGDAFCVHCLDLSYGEGLNESVFVQMLRRLDESLTKGGMV